MLNPRHLTALISTSLILLFSGASVSACPYCSTNKAYLETMPTALMERRGNLHHPVSTADSEAQAYFDQGLTMCYAFNHDEAIRSFCKASSLDSNLAMAHWGIAYALGSNYNRPIDSLQAAGAWEEIKKARALMQHATQQERDYIEALSKRYTSDPKADYVPLEREYSKAMKALSAKYPDDLDAAAIYAESMMNLNPWKLWDRKGKPNAGTEDIVKTLESILARDPNHPGANHFYIHAVEASKDPGKALPSAKRLPGLVPAAGHLVHMPAHTYIRLGDYEGCINANRAAVKADSTYFAGGGLGFYGLAYYSHNMHFLAVACAFAGRFEEAMDMTRRLENHIYPFAYDPMVGGILPTRYFILTKFQKWDDILATSIPDSGQAIMETFRHFARAMALAAKGDVKQANASYAAFEDAEKRLPEVCIIGAMNDARYATEIARHMLRAKIAQAEGKRDDAIKHLRQAVAAQDTLSYDEPEGWYINARESLGALLLESGKAAEAEKVFREELAVHHNSGRALYGLWESLKAQKRDSEAVQAKAEFDKAWKLADTELTMSGL